VRENFDAQSFLRDLSCCAELLYIERDARPERRREKVKRRRPGVLATARYRLVSRKPVAADLHRELEVVLVGDDDSGL